MKRRKRQKAQVMMPTKTVKKKAEVKVKEEAEEMFEERETAFDAFVDHQRKAAMEASKALLSLLPVAFKEHGEAAVKEVIEGYRQLVNSTIDEIIDAIEKVRVETNKAEDKVVSDLHSVKEEVAKV